MSGSNIDDKGVHHPGKVDLSATGDKNSNNKVQGIRKSLNNNPIKICRF